MFRARAVGDGGLAVGAELAGLGCQLLEQLALTVGEAGRDLDVDEHVQVVRIGTRTPVVLPYRITDGLVDRVVAPGTYEATWEGRDEAGRSAAAGVYFACLASDGLSPATRKIVLLR